MGEPRCVGRKAIDLPDLFGGEVIEGPQPLVRMHGRSGQAEADKTGRER